MLTRMKGASLYRHSLSCLKYTRVLFHYTNQTRNGPDGIEPFYEGLTASIAFTESNSDIKIGCGGESRTRL